MIQSVNEIKHAYTQKVPWTVQNSKRTFETLNLDTFAQNGVTTENDLTKTVKASNEMRFRVLLINRFL